MAANRWTHGAPNMDELSSLVRTLTPILGAFTESQRNSFAVEVSQALELYFQGVQPGVQDDATVRPALERVAKTAAEFVAAMNQLGEAGRRELETGLYFVSGKSVLWPELTERTDATVAWAEEIWTRAIAKAAARAKDRPAKRGRPKNRDVDWLIGELAVAYANSFGERPSSARGGVFTKILGVILPLAGVEVQIAEQRLKENILRRQIKAPAPSRGRKRRAD